VTGLRLPDWTPYAGSAVCPECGAGGQLEFKSVLRAKPLGTFSLAGAQMKFPAREGFAFRCGACGATGPAAAKEDEAEDSD
jgi:hypothetical protein